MKRVTATASTRVDLAGGTIDLWPIHQLLPAKATVNYSVALPAIAEAFLSERHGFISVDQNLHVEGPYDELTVSEALPLFAGLLKEFWGAHLPAVTIKTTAKSPAGAGLGGSSCLGMAIARALVELRTHCGDSQLVWDEADAVARLRDIESVVISAPTGIQDYWGGIRGGVTVIEYPPGQPRVTTTRDLLYRQLTEATLLVYPGKSRASAMNNLAIFQSFLNGDASVVEHLRHIGELAVMAANAAALGDFHGILGASRSEWEVRCQLWPGIVTDETTAIDRAAQQAGAYFSRVCGAGGGGVVAVLTPPERREAVAEACKAAGGSVLMLEGQAKPLQVNGQHE